MIALVAVLHEGEIDGNALLRTTGLSFDGLELLLQFVGSQGGITSHQTVGIIDAGAVNVLRPKDARELRVGEQARQTLGGPANVSRLMVVRAKRDEDVFSFDHRLHGLNGFIFVL